MADGSKPSAGGAPRIPPAKHRARPNTAETPLSARERAFVAHYCAELNLTKAAYAAGYTGSKHNVSVTAARLIREPHVAQAIATNMAERMKRLGITADRVVRDIDIAANLDIAELFDADGNLLPVQLMPAHVRRNIVSIEVVKKNLVAGDGQVDMVHKVKFTDRTRMHEILARYTRVDKGEGDGQASDVPAFKLPDDTPGVSVH